MGLEVAVFGGGCFWCTEAIFSRLRGVRSVASGYAGGNVARPTYEQVSNGNTGHAEVIKIEYDSTIIPYSTLLDVFFHLHDPTTLNQQGADIGTQYRSVIFFTSEKQKDEAEQMIVRLDASHEFNASIVTTVEPLETFYRAENYHQEYFKVHSELPYCNIVIAPKVQKLMKEYLSLVK